MREISGDIIIPSDSPTIKESVVLLEVRDVSRADALSAVVAQTRLNHVNFGPGDRIRFSLTVPEVSDTQSLNLRIHISSAGSDRIMPGDLLTTRSYPLPSRGTIGDISVLVERI